MEIVDSKKEDTFLNSITHLFDSNKGVTSFREKVLEGLISDEINQSNYRWKQL